MQICTVPTVLTARRRLAAALNAEGADGLSNANTVETSIPAAFVEARAQPQRCSTVQHRIRGALNAAGFESAVRKFSSGECKGATVFSRVQREPDTPLRWQKEGSVTVEQAPTTALHDGQCKGTLCVRNMACNASRQRLWVTPHFM